MTVFRMRYKNYDPGKHLIQGFLQSSPDLGGNWFPCGNLMVPKSDFEDLRKSMPGIEFEEIS